MSADEAKKLSDRVIVALDTDNLRSARKIIKALKGSIRIFKVGSTLFTACGPRAVEMVKKEGADVFLDLKYHDIPNTVACASRMAARLGVFMFNVHAAGGLQMMQEACVAAADEARKCNVPSPKLIAVTMLTSLSQEEVNQELLIPLTVEDVVLKYAENAQKAGLDGIVASAMEAERMKQRLGSNFMIVTPGIRPGWADKADQERVVTPRKAFELGSDYIVIGRPLTEAPDPAEAAARLFDEL